MRRYQCLLAFGLAFAMVESLVGGMNGPTGPDSSAFSLKEFLQEVYARNPAIRSALHQAQSVYAQVKQSTAWDDPSLGVEYRYIPTSSLRFWNTAMEKDYFIRQMIPFPGKKGAMGDAAVFKAAMADQDADCRFPRSRRLRRAEA